MIIIASIVGLIAYYTITIAYCSGMVADSILLHQKRSQNQLFWDEGP